eukprot:gnl/TRDRNA2_/TRDRNA2_64839_c0_seq1.p1 gnl/TRDRNA2_/TRDRNA2_64839_c0~~gnl/TRDRNA2_/TRDRNA2_64839_c0_seq1.p1  ORF type:complete len:240 (+),score=41.86 gnl/TRDRNA2_/TRDRNA2_64839_c0_seq1:600-1319(+)
MVPFADLLNHESAYNAEYQRYPQTGGVFLRAVSNIDPGTEVTVNYGSHSNHVLLISYGFVDLVSWSDELRVDLLGPQEAAELREKSQLRLSANSSMAASSLLKALEILRLKASASALPGSEDAKAQTRAREEAALGTVHKRCSKAAHRLVAGRAGRKAARHARECFGYRVCLAVWAAACADFARLALQTLAGEKQLADGAIVNSSRAARLLSSELLATWRRDAVRIGLLTSMTGLRPEL